jgi:hypothetical protein
MSAMNVPMHSRNAEKCARAMPTISQCHRTSVHPCHSISHFTHVSKCIYLSSGEDHHPMSAMNVLMHSYNAKKCARVTSTILLCHWTSRMDLGCKMAAPGRRRGVRRGGEVSRSMFVSCTSVVGRLEWRLGGDTSSLMLWDDRARGGGERNGSITCTSGRSPV